LEASALNHAARLPAVAGRTPLLRLQSDDKLIALIRRGQHAAFETLVQRYQARLLAFCRHMLGSTEDAEDVLQEVFAAAFNAICADERPINARPWLYRIARNRCLNHLRRPVPAGQDSMDIFERDGGATTADTVSKREEFRHIVHDVQQLPETQRTALLLREIDALSYEQISEAMDTTVPSVKSLLVRARVSLAEAAEARLLTCGEVRLELGHVAEGLVKTSAPVRRHLKTCERCRVFRGELQRANRALAAVYPIGPLVILKSFFLAKLGGGAASGGATAGGSSAAAGLAGGAAATAGGGAAGGVVSAGVSTLASKTAAGLAAAALVTAGAVEVKHVSESGPAQSAAVPAQVAPAAPQVAAIAPAPVRATPPRVSEPPAAEPKPGSRNTRGVVREEEPVAQEPVTAPVESTEPAESEEPAVPVEQEDGSTVTLEPDAPADGGSSGGQQPSHGTQPSTPPGESSRSPQQPQPAPAAGDPSSGRKP
jgi:RNA polymerase sigma factor (sigma-70 family)